MTGASQTTWTWTTKAGYRALARGQRAHRRHIYIVVDISEGHGEGNKGEHHALVHTALPEAHVVASSCACHPGHMGRDYMMCGHMFTRCLTCCHTPITPSKCARMRSVSLKCTVQSSGRLHPAQEAVWHTFLANLSFAGITETQEGFSETAQVYARMQLLQSSTSG